MSMKSETPFGPPQTNHSAIVNGGRARKLFHFGFAAALLVFMLFQASRWLPASVTCSTKSPNALKKQCPAISQRFEQYDFDNLTDFSLLQDFGMFAKSAPWDSNVNGTISFIPGSADQKNDIHIEISINSSSSAIANHTQIEKYRDSLLVTFPVKANDTSHSNRWCLDFSIDVYIRPETELNHLGLDAAVSSVIIKEGLRLKVKERTAMSVLFGNVLSEAPFESKNTLIGMRYGSVFGNFTVDDSLDIRTTFGAVFASIGPISAMAKTDVPSFLSVTSQKGLVGVLYPWTGFGHLLERPYYTKIWTETGTIRGRYLLGAETSIHTNTGSINVDVLPYLVTNTSTLITNSTLGSQNIHFVVPEGSNITTIDNVKSTHVATAGPLNLRYPWQWQGSLYGETKAGWLGIEGQFDEITNGSKGIVGRWVKAVKGKGASEIDFRTTIGNAYLTFEDN